MKQRKFTWGDRFALIDQYRPSDRQVCAAFNVTPAELSSAREFRATGMWRPTSGFDASAYPNVFDVDVATANPSVTKHVRIQEEDKAQTASKRTKEPQKRGRKGNKIETAFANIPDTPVPFDDFAEQYDVSTAVLRQSKRFDKFPERGQIHIKKDKGTGQTMIWRQTSSENN